MLNNSRTKAAERERLVYIGDVNCKYTYIERERAIHRERERERESERERDRERESEREIGRAHV